MSSLADIPKESQCKQFIHEILTNYQNNCGHQVVWRRNCNYGWCKICQKKVRPKAKSWLFYGCKLSYRQIFTLVWHWQHRSSPGSVVNAMGLSYTTIARWYRRFRESLPPEDKTKLSGIVEVDESYFGKRRYGHQTIVIGAIERFPDPVTKLRRLKFRIILNTEQETLEQFIQDTIALDSLVITDCHSGYNDLEFLGWSHEAWNHSRGHLAGTNHIEQTWSVMKRYLRKLYGNIPTKDLQLILNEFMARHNQPELFSSPEEYLRGVIPD